MIPRLPTYLDLENAVFHPAFEYAMKEALKHKNLGYVEVRKQYSSPTGPIDIVLFNTITQKVILPIEIKRTQSNVRGGGRRQARDYWQNLGNECETLFYCVSNLELTELFRFEATRPKTTAQQVKLENPISGDLANITDLEFFYNNLINNINEILDIVIGQKPYIYNVGLYELQNSLESSVRDIQTWHKMLLPTCFEYIRGAAKRVPNLNKNNWKPAKFYLATPTRLITFGQKIDFEHIFKEPAPNPNDNKFFSNTVLTEAYNAGKTLGMGDDIAELINEILVDYVPKKQGIVETDTELALLLSVIAKITLGRELERHESIIDPASGSGRLLTVLNHISFKNILPSQIKAIEKEPLFSEALSLRLGLAFGENISPLNSPKVTIAGVENIEKAYFDDVRVVLMNPPYISGVQSAEIKKVFSNRIFEISKEESLLDIGQAALEILFLELICQLVTDGTVISVIYPSNHLYRISKEMTAFRNYLLEHFGLSYIVTYPRNGLFSSVVKSTVIFSGIKGRKVDKVNLIEVWKSVNDVKFIDLYNTLFSTQVQDDENVDISNLNIDGVSFREISVSDLKIKNHYGWRGVIGDGIGEQYDKFMESYMSDFNNIDSSDISRGGFGNKGNNDLTVIDKNKGNPILSKIPNDWLIPLLNNTKDMPRSLIKTSATNISFIPPESAYKVGTKEALIFDSIIKEYLDGHRCKQGSQKKKIPDREHVIASLKSNSRAKYSNLILLPRGSRKQGQIGIVESHEILVSTNVLLIKTNDPKHLKLMGAWLLSIFGQLQLELNGVSQEGMRKLEANIVQKIRYPKFDEIQKDKADKLMGLFKTEDCLNFKDIQEREIDRLWAKIISPNDHLAVLENAFELFQELIDQRNGLG
ncbi:BpuSI family type II restriction endonuclease [Acinetobacter ursingii]|uniref:BpuSI family type II restriction endonuclease n=1 Tax=Acinetobacter ursingii TaxID=108980 RepID=UPI0021CDA54B|nr:BpuSI family type II restriction endonuclease [Acinetobacter ursingii]MCU4588704.1 BpuSI family type II restriction endonuclease [Acinetobacter ursingii]